MHAATKVGLAGAIIAATGAVAMLGSSRDRALMVVQHNLSAPEVQAYDSCISAIAGFATRNADTAKPKFCACIATVGAKRLADRHKHLAGIFAEAMVEKDAARRERLMRAVYAAVERAGLWNPPAIARTVGDGIDYCVSGMLVEAGAMAGSKS